MLKTLKLTARPEPGEAQLQKMLLKRLHASGWLAVRVNSGVFKTDAGTYFRAYSIEGAPDQSAGFPDVLALRQKRGGAMETRLFEVKRRGGRRSAAQERFAAHAARCGVTVEVVTGLDGLERLRY